MAYSLILDADVDPARRKYAERFLNKALPRINMLKEEIETDDPVIAELLATYASSSGDSGVASDIRA